MHACMHRCVCCALSSLHNSHSHDIYAHAHALTRVPINNALAQAYAHAPELVVAADAGAPARLTLALQTLVRADAPPPAFPALAPLALVLTDARTAAFFTPALLPVVLAHARAAALAALAFATVVRADARATAISALALLPAVWTLPRGASFLLAPPCTALPSVGLAASPPSFAPSFAHVSPLSYPTACGLRAVDLDSVRGHCSTRNPADSACRHVIISHY